MNASEGFSNPGGFIHTFYIYDIGPPDKYTGAFEKIRNAGEGDQVIIRVNSPGGNLMTAIQFMRAIMESKARIVVSIEGSCMSAATFFLMVADDVQVTDHSLFMFHNYSAIHVGKGGEMWDAVFHERSWSAKLLTDIYKGFFSPEEIEEMLNNRDFWLSGDDVVNRIQARKALLDEEQTKRQQEDQQKFLEYLKSQETGKVSTLVPDVPATLERTPVKKRTSSRKQ
jgi:ATP-dependent protease ClpP protease subunit